MTSAETLALIKLASKPALQASIPLLKKLKDRVSQYLNDGILDYLSTSIDKYKDIKTLLHRQPTSFYDIYYPTKLQWNDDVITTDSVSQLFNQHNCITIIGDAGSGKSTLVKHLFLSSLLQAYKTPILVTLRDLNIQKSNLEIYIREEILKNKLSPSDDYLNKLLEDGEFLFILDGYDEIKSSEKQEITKTLESFIDTYPKNNFILTSRPYSNIEYFKNFQNYLIKDLTRKDQAEFIKLEVKENILAEKIIESIQEAKQKYIDSFLKNSLLLTLYILAYSKNSSIPSNKYIFYRRVFDVLFAEHDSATKIGFEREIKTQLDQESLEKILQIFCFLSYFAHEFNFDKTYVTKILTSIKKNYKNFIFDNNDFIDDMKLTIGLWTEDSGVYSFAHRSMQEYFASTYIQQMDKDSKKKVYEKITNFNNGSPLAFMDFDMQNFLSLCYEMDRNNFIQYYSIPVIKKIKQLFVNNGVLNYEFTYMNEGFYCDIDRSSFIITDDFVLINNMSITPNNNFSFILDDLGFIFSKSRTHKDFEKYIKAIPVHDKHPDIDERYSLPKDDQITQKYIDFLEEIGVTKKLKSYVKKLEKMETEFETELKKSQTIEDDFISMI